MKVADLKGDDLDVAVAVALGKKYPRPANPYSTSWADTGPLIDKHEIKLDIGRTWEATCEGRVGKGNTALEAVCRAFVIAKVGEEISGFDE